MKHLHRLITTSRTYQLKSSADGENLAEHRRLDPDNKLLWRSNIRRLDAEIIRDSVLHVAGNLDLQRGGSDIDFQQGEANPRRSIYFRHAYEKQMTMLVTFDAASTTDCYRRGESIIPQQALAMSNSVLVIEQSRRLAKTISDQAMGDSEFTRLAFQTILSRECSEQERSTCVDFLQSQGERLNNSSELTTVVSTAKAKTPAAESPSQRARENLVHVLMNHNDFITVR